MLKLKDILAEVQLHGQAGNRREVAKVLRPLVQNKEAYYKQSIQENLQEEFSTTLYKALLLELDEEEEDSITIAELAYLGLSSAIYQNLVPNPESYECRLLLVHYFNDFFTDSIIEVFLSKYRETNVLEARSLAIECLEKMQLADMFYLEDNEADFINGNEQISDACSSIETSSDLSEEERESAVLLHQVLYAYLLNKYKKLS